MTILAYSRVRTSFFQASRSSPATPPLVTAGHEPYLLILAPNLRRSLSRLEGLQYKIL